MSKINNIEENELDQLLQSYCLEDDTFASDELAARIVLTGDYSVKIDTSKEKQLLSKLNRGNKGGNFLLLLFIVAIAFIGPVIYLSQWALYSGQVKQTTISLNNEHVITNNNTLPYPPYNRDRLPEIENNVQQKLPLLFTNTKRDTVQENDSAINLSYYSPLHPPELLLAEKMPQLSLAEIARYKKVKSLMLKKLLEADEELYTNLEAAKIQYAGKSTEVDAFAIRNYDITNLEYKVFLADLVNSSRAEDYRKAQVITDTWNNYSLSGFASTYMQQDKYNDFPVVNITKEGATLFCEWLAQQVNELGGTNASKTKRMIVRLPYDIEWIYAARTGYAQVPDCGGFNTIFDFNEGYVDQGFIKRIATIKKRDKSSATELDQLFATNRYGMSETEVNRIFERGLSYFSSTPSDTIYPSRIQAFGKAAHVSEMIFEKRSGRPIVMGSCWKDKEEYLKMLEKFGKASCSPYIGFRFVVINGKPAVYKNPFY